MERPTAAAGSFTTTMTQAEEQTTRGTLNREYSTETEQCIGQTELGENLKVNKFNKYAILSYVARLGTLEKYATAYFTARVSTTGLTVMHTWASTRPAAGTASATWPTATETPTEAGLRTQSTTDRENTRENEIEPQRDHSKRFIAVGRAETSTSATGRRELPTATESSPTTRDRVGGRDTREESGKILNFFRS
jgi:hypothetical protein